MNQLNEDIRQDGIEAVRIISENFNRIYPNTITDLNSKLSNLNSKLSHEIKTTIENNYYLSTEAIIETYNTYSTNYNDTKQTTYSKCKQNAEVIRDILMTYFDCKFGPIEGQIDKIIGSSCSSIRQNFINALEFIPTDWITMTVASPYYTKLHLRSLRSNSSCAYICIKRDKLILGYNKNYGYYSLIHEFCHYLEHLCPKLPGLERRYLLSCPTINGFSYASTKYDSYKFELLSVGTESLFSCPDELIKKNYEYACWILGLILNANKYIRN